MLTCLILSGGGSDAADAHGAAQSHLKQSVILEASKIVLCTR